MIAKKQVLYDLRTTYDGPFLVEDFYAEVDNWIKEKGFEKEPKKKMEHVTKDGKKIEWLISMNQHLGEVSDEEIVLRALFDNIIVLRALFDNIKEVVIKKDGNKIRVNHGDVFVNIDGWVIRCGCGTWWEVKPIYYFIRALVDKYIYKFWSEKYDGEVQTDCHDLFKRIRAFFGLQKFKYIG